MATATVAQTVVNALREIGVTRVFGVPSGGWVDYMEAIRNADGIEFVLTTHEGGAGFMADVHGRLTGVPGVCFGTFGPGATNLATGVGSAYLDRSPMIALSDEQPARLRGRTVQMGIDHQALFGPITKHTTRLEASRVRSILFNAANTALSGRPGPVHVGLPVDISADMAGKENITADKPENGPRASDKAVSRMRMAFARAERPILVVGLAGTRGDLPRRILSLAETFSLPVVLTPMAKGVISQRHRLYAGVLFHALSDFVSETHRESDLVVAIGYDPVEVSYESWISDAPLIHIDETAADIEPHSQQDIINVVGSVSWAIDHLAQTDCPAKSWDINALEERRQRLFEAMKPNNRFGFGPCAVLDTLRDVLPDDGVLACDVGAHTHLIGQKWPTPAPGKLLMTNGWSAMGFGIPAAISAKLCLPDRPVCAVIGDGGFLMTAGELAVAVRLDLKIVFILLTDDDLALIRIKQERRNNPIYGTVVREGGSLGSGNIFGTPVLTANNPAAFRSALERAFEVDGPVIVEALINSREYDELVLR